MNDPPTLGTSMNASKINSATNTSPRDVQGGGGTFFNVDAYNQDKENQVARNNQ